MMQSFGHNSCALSYWAPGIFQGTYEYKELLERSEAEVFTTLILLFVFSTVAEDNACTVMFNKQIVLKRTPT